LSDTEYIVDDVHFGQLLRDRFNCELGVVEANTINQVSVKQALKHADFLSMVNRNYNIFNSMMTGSGKATGIPSLLPLWISRPIGSSGEPVAKENIMRRVCLQGAKK